MVYPVLGSAAGLCGYIDSQSPGLEPGMGTQADLPRVALKPVYEPGRNIQAA